MIQTIKLIGKDAETQGELLREFFNGCYHRGHRPVAVEYGWLVYEDDKQHIKRGYNLLIGTYDTNTGGRLWVA